MSLLPTTRLAVLVMAAAPLFMGGVLYPPLALAGFLYAALLLLFVGLNVALLPGPRSVEIRRILPERLSLGAPARVTVEVRSRARRTVEVSLAENPPQTMDVAPLTSTVRVSPGARRTVHYRLTPRARGHFELAGPDVRLLPAGSLLYRQFTLRDAPEVDVFPNLAQVRRYDLMVRRGAARDQGLARIRQIGQGSEFESLRYYVPGDDLSRVDWKATAKRNRLVVRNYQPEREQSVLVAIDCGRATAGEFGGFSRLDYLVNAALMLAYVALRQGDWFSLIAFSDRIESYLPPVRRLRSLERVAISLYRLEPRLVESDYENACRFLDLKNRKRSLVCLMTDVLGPDASDVIIEHMARFARYHLPLAVTLADPDVIAAADAPIVQGSDPYAKAVALDVLEARRETLFAMRRRGVGVLDVQPQELTPALVDRYCRVKAAKRL